MDVYVVCKSLAFPFNNFRIMLPFVAVLLYCRRQVSAITSFALMNECTALRTGIHIVAVGKMCIPNSSYAQ